MNKDRIVYKYITGQISLLKFVKWLKYMGYSKEERKEIYEIAS